MVQWSEQGPLKLIMLWLNNLICLWHFTGFIFTIILLKQFSSDTSACKDSFFAYYLNGSMHNMTSGCYITPEGQSIFILYFIFNGTGLIILLLSFYHLIVIPWLNRDKENCAHHHLLSVLFIIPTYIVAAACITFSVLYPKMFLRSDLVTVFSRKWMGHTTKEWTSQVILIMQTVYLVANVAELVIGSGLVLSGYYSNYLIFYLVFASINALVRFIVFGIRFMKTAYEYIKDDFFGVCCQEINRASHDEI